MKLFISWSGAKSRAAAEALRNWIPLLFENVDPWMSAKDIAAGARWGREVQDQLTETNLGIVCLTRSNIEAPWILFETGALAKSVSDARVIPYLLDLEAADLPSGPLIQFQAKRASRDDTLEVVRTINDSLGKHRRDEMIILKLFERVWSDLEEELSKLPEESKKLPRQRSGDDMLAEILTTVRGLERRLGSRPWPDCLRSPETHRDFSADPPSLGELIARGSIDPRVLDFYQARNNVPPSPLALLNAYEQLQRALGMVREARIAQEAEGSEEIAGEKAVEGEEPEVKGENPTG